MRAPGSVKREAGEVKEREVLPPSLTLALPLPAAAACALVPQRLVHASLGRKRARSSRRWSTSPPPPAAVQASRSSWARHVGDSAYRAASPARPLQHGAPQGMQEGVLRRIGPAMAARLQREQEAGGQVTRHPAHPMARVQQEAAAVKSSSLGQSPTAARWRHETIKTPPALESPQHSMASTISSEVSESRPTGPSQPVLR